MSFSRPVTVQSIIRPNKKEGGDNIYLYTSDAIQSHPKVSLTREGLFLLAILNGGDYDAVCFLFISQFTVSLFIYLQVGLAGCGPTIAHKLAQSDLAGTLFRATLGLPREALSEFLVDWRKKLKHQLTLDSNGLLGRKHPAVAQNVSSNFPSIEILLLYADPVTSWKVDIVPDSSQWTLRQPDLPAIGLLCEKSFSWGTSGQMIARFQQNVWRGIVMRYLLQVIDLVQD
jgi:Holliday junction resolvase YEN1